jgi:hypothetical protein
MPSVQSFGNPFQFANPFVAFTKIATECKLLAADLKRNLAFAVKHWKARRCWRDTTSVAHTDRAEAGLMVDFANRPHSVNAEFFAVRGLSWIAQKKIVMPVSMLGSASVTAPLQRGPIHR